ncbi:hypothetical protein QT381_13960 [Galbitalea sp. SE-J8]|uniref:hypothetical protein n=1 Tax=Galbitalea sp. SE-J8 TaxID=3054952 RepID=UPI00259CF5F1|nr:hypothetical protein [Galbitalea sp. SE-J8]MDM4764112.1 hypothetical protein [Galbitalea sp. SE-J8]
MRRSRSCADGRRRDDTGSASIELITAGVLLLVPLVYLVLVVSAVQGAALAVEGGARQAARVFVQQADAASARAAAQRAVDLALDDFGLDSGSARVEVACSEPDCLASRSFVTVRVRASVALPLVPPVLRLNVATAVPVGASATEQVSRFRSDG